MRTARLEGDGVTIRYEENPQGQFLIVTDELYAFYQTLKKPSINNDFTNFIETATVEEINVEKKEIYKKKIYEIVDKLTFSARERVLGKVGENLTENQLDKFEKRYAAKRQTADDIINGNTNYDQILHDLISFEVESDFAGEKLNQAVHYLNSLPNVSIPTNVSRLLQYCYLIKAKYSLGEKDDIVFNSLIEYFRSKMITWLDFFEFEKIDQGEYLIYTIQPSHSINDFMLIKNQFDEI